MFKLGKIFATRAVAETISTEMISLLLIRYLSGDWGDTCESDKLANDLAIQGNQRVVASYMVEGEHIFIITEADRSYTTLMLTYEY